MLVRLTKALQSLCKALQIAKPVEQVRRSAAEQPYVWRYRAVALINMHMRALLSVQARTKHSQCIFAMLYFRKTMVSRINVCFKCTTILIHFQVFFPLFSLCLLVYLCFNLIKTIPQVFQLMVLFIF